MQYIVACRNLIEANIEAAVSSCCNASVGLSPDKESGHFVFEALSPAGKASLLAYEMAAISTQAAVIVPIPIPRLFTEIEPTTTMERLRPFFRGVLKAAVLIWSKERKYGRDFDLDGIFYRNPFSSKDDLWHQTLVMIQLKHHGGDDVESSLRDDIVLAAFGRFGDGLPRLEEFREVCGEAFEDLLKKCQVVLSSLGQGNLATLAENTTTVPLSVTLEGVRPPAWLSYDQWMRKLVNTEQGAFIISPISGPQRVDGPAGTGKTLSLVLKCLYTLKAAAKEGKPHHAAFVVFSDETKRKVIEAFLDPLDEDEFHAKERESGDRQTLTVTTLLDWSRKELKSVVGAFDLPAENAAQARVDQRALVAEALDNHLAAYFKSVSTALSSEMRGLCGAGVTPVLVDMFLHEFGVIIKGMADSSLRRYLASSRPAISLPCGNEADRRFVFALFAEYEDLLRAYGVVDLDDVAVSHIKLLEMPLRRDVREGLAFDSVFVDEAHSFNPNELAIFFLLTRRAEVPPLVVAVDLPQAVGDKGYDGGGLERAILEEFEAKGAIEVRRFSFEDIRRCSQPVLNLVASIYSQGAQFMQPIHVPAALKSARGEEGRIPVAKGFDSQESMLEGAFAAGEEIVARLRCARSDVLIVLMHDGLETALAPRLAARAEVLTKRSDVDSERRAERLNHFVVARAEYLHGLEYEAVVLVGVSMDEIPRVEHTGLGAGAAALFETQRVVDLLYLSLTRARREAEILFVRAPSFLLKAGIDRRFVVVESAKR